MHENYLGIVIDESRTQSMSEQAQQLITKFYRSENLTVQQIFARAAVAWSTYHGETDLDMAQRIYNYASWGWFGFASPVLSNAALPGQKPAGLPISCFAGYVDDSIEGLIEHSSEFRRLSVKGGGYGGHWSDVRSVSDKAPGPIPFMKTIDADATAYKQGITRRASCAAYLSVRHPDIWEFVQIRIPTGDSNRKCLGVGFHNAVSIPDDFMEAVVNGSNWDLVDPHDGGVRETIKARDLWELIMETRVRTGEPYLFFEDTANKHLPEAQKKLGLKVNGSNLCVAPETQILTSEGYKRIESLKDKEVEVWNGQEWSNTTVRKTSDSSKLIRVTFSNGSEIECTEYHKFYVQDDYHSKPREVRAKDLIPGDKLAKWEMPDGEEHFVTVISVEDHGRYDATYCFTEPKRHMGVFNGILAGNCSEIMLPTGYDMYDQKRTFVCCLSSINYEKYDQWAPHIDEFVGDLVTMLDNVLESFIENAPKEIKDAVYSAYRERAIGLGDLGIAALFQKEGLAWGSKEALELDEKVHKEVKRSAVRMSRTLGFKRGEAPDMVGTGMRNSHLMAIAPTANNSIIVGTSPGIEPWTANAFAHRTRVGTHYIKNKHLVNVLRAHDMDTKEVWSDITLNDGSVQHLDFLTKEEKDVFKTAVEIDQAHLIEHAAVRGKYVCQGQSLNLFFAPTATRRYVNMVHINAWKMGLKSLYYFRTTARNRADSVGKKLERVALKDGVQKTPEDNGECAACEG